MNIGNDILRVVIVWSEAVMQHSVGMSKAHERDDPKAKHACDGGQPLEKDLTV